MHYIIDTHTHTEKTVQILITNPLDLIVVYKSNCTKFQLANHTSNYTYI